MPQTIRSLLGVPPSTPSVEDSVLLIIDAQNEYAEGTLKIKDVEVSRKVLETLLKKYRSSHGTIMHIVHDTPNGAPIFTPDTHLADIFKELTPEPNEQIIHKQHAGSFTGTTLKEELEKTGKKKLVLAGYMAHQCISSTSRAGAELGYDISVVRDAVGDRDLPNATADELVRVTLAALADMNATILEAKDI